MLFPGSRIWYEGTAADLASLTEELKTTGFSGHIVLEFQDSVDIVICVGGEFLKVVEKIGRRLLSTKKYREIWGKCQIKPGRMQIFELPPPLAQKIRGLRGRRLLCSGTAATGCDPDGVLADRRKAGFSGLLDCVSPEGKLLLDYDGGTILSCYYTEYEGLVREGLDAFKTWHRGFLRATHPSFMFLSDLGGAPDVNLWDEILMDYAEQLPLPLPSSLQRLQRAFGREAAPGAEIFVAGAQTEHACYVLEGRVALLRGSGPTARPCGALRPGNLVGISWAFGLSSPHLTGKALEPCRYLAFRRRDLPLLFQNSPSLAARCIRETAGSLLGSRARLEAYREDPRLLDVEQAVVAAVGNRGQDPDAGVTAAELFGELTHNLPLSLPEIDDLFRKLAALGGIRQSGGRVALECTGL